MHSRPRTSRSRSRSSSPAAIGGTGRAVWTSVGFSRTAPSSACGIPGAARGADARGQHAGACRAGSRLCRAAPVAVAGVGRGPRPCLALWCPCPHPLRRCACPLAGRCREQRIAQLCRRPTSGRAGRARSLDAALEQRPGRGIGHPPQADQMPRLWARKSRPAPRLRMSPARTVPSAVSVADAVPRRGLGDGGLDHRRDRNRHGRVRQRAPAAWPRGPGSPRATTRVPASRRVRGREGATCSSNPCCSPPPLRCGPRAAVTETSTTACGPAAARCGRSWPSLTSCSSPRSIC